jgi:hypothetical protein
MSVNQCALIAAAALAMMLGGCSHFDTDLDFRAPRGWIHLPVATLGDVWIKGGGSHEKIMTKSADFPLSVGSGEAVESITICHGHPAKLILSLLPTEVWEAVSTKWGAKRYMAVYTRPIMGDPDPQAEAAIRTLCLRNHRLGTGVDTALPTRGPDFSHLIRSGKPH